MNIKQVKEQWTLETLLDKLGFEPDHKKSKGSDLWYSSPFRVEGDSSFHIDARRDIWMDFGLAEEKSGGDLIFFAQRYLQEQGREYSISSVLEWFSEFSAHGMHSPPQNVSKPTETEKQHQFRLLSAKPIFTQALFDYLEERKIGRSVALSFLLQVYFEHAVTGKKIFGLAMKNQSEGYEVRNPLGFKGVIGAKDVSFLKGTDRSRVAVFEGMFDFLSWATLSVKKHQPALTSDVIILHTNRMYERAAEIIRSNGYSQVDLWLDNDAGGEQGRQSLEAALEKDQGLEFNTQNEMYKGFKDVNEWACAT